jgi:hypothetical protein
VFAPARTVVPDPVLVTATVPAPSSMTPMKTRPLSSDKVSMTGPA